MNKYETAILMLESQREGEFIGRRVASYSLAIEALKEKAEREIETREES